MNATLLLGAAVILSAPAPKEPPKTESLEGEWQVVAAEANGIAAPAGDIKSLRLVFKGDTMTIQQKGEAGSERKKTFKLDSSKTPKQLDITENADKAECIYSLEKGQLRVCMPRLAKFMGKRPTEFMTTQGDGLMVIVLERVTEK